VVRATGGLADTVFDVDSEAPPPEGQHPNGFTFTGADEASEDSALDRAFRC
jgi:starch synthase